MRVWCETLTAQTGASGFHETKTVDIPSSHVFVSCALTKIIQAPSSVNVFGGEFITAEFITANMAITSYVKDVDPHSGDWQAIEGHNITSVTFTLFVVNAYAAATGTIMFID